MSISQLILYFTFSLPLQMSWYRGQVNLGQCLLSVHQKPQSRVGTLWMFGKWMNQQRELPFCLSSWARSAQLSVIWSPTCLAGGELGTGCTVTFPKPSHNIFGDLEQDSKFRIQNLWCVGVLRPNVKEGDIWLLIPKHWRDLFLPSLPSALCYHMRRYFKYLPNGSAWPPLSLELLLPC